MSIRMFFSCVVVLGVVAGGALAQAPEPTKIGFVDVERAVVSIEEGKARLQELENWAKPRQEELQKLGKEINDLQNDIAAKRGVASDEALEQLQQQLLAKQRAFEDRQRVARREFEEKQDAILRDIGAKMQQVIQGYAEKSNYAAVFLFKPNEVAYLAPSADLTDLVIKLYNEKHPFKAAATGGK